MKTFGYCQPHPSEVISGDAWATLPGEKGTRVVVVDGAGHGEHAAAAASLALKSLSESSREPLAHALERCHRVLHGSRGAAVSVIEITGDKLEFAGVGNVDCRLVTPTSEHRLMPQRGIIGVVLPSIRPLTMPFGSPDWAVLLFSDGINQRFKAGWSEIVADPAQFVVDAVQEWGRQTDDATVVVTVSGEH